MTTDDPKIMRKTGDRPYEEGDRLIARDLVGGNVERIGTVGQIGTDGRGKDYMVIRHGDEPFIEAFLATQSDVVMDLPEDIEDAEQLIQWLESGA